MGIYTHQVHVTNKNVENATDKILTESSIVGFF